MNEDRKLLLQLIAGLSLCDTVGDIADDVAVVMKRLGYEIDEDSGDGNYLSAVRARLARDGVTTLYGTRLAE